MHFALNYILPQYDLDHLMSSSGLGLDMPLVSVVSCVMTPPHLRYNSAPPRISRCPAFVVGSARLAMSTETARLLLGTTDQSLSCLRHSSRLAMPTETARLLLGIAVKESLH